eukprot:s3081_g3.t1
MRCFKIWLRNIKCVSKFGTSMYWSRSINSTSEDCKDQDKAPVATRTHGQFTVQRTAKSLFWKWVQI